MSYSPLQFADPRHRQVERDLEIVLDNAYRLAAHAHLDLWRQQLAQFNLRRHVIVVRAVHGLNTLYVGDSKWWELRPGHAVTDLLISIGSSVESASWGGHLIGEVL